MSELHLMSATEALSRFAARELSPVELLDAVIARAEAVEGVVNALPVTLYEQAREQAREAEARYAGRGEAPRALEGIPLAVKEEEAVAGQPWTQGSLIHRDTVADYTSAFARRILDSGAIVHARSSAPEYSCAGFTHSRLWGVTRNPHNPEFASGGSSGGAGASLASGTSTLASGSDIGGSIRIPSSFCGVVGFKAPYGRVPVDPPFNLDVYCHCGPMARTVSDCLLFENVVAGPDPSDVTTLRPKLVLDEQIGSARGMRVALSTDLGGWPVDPEVRANTLAVGEALRAAGAQVDEVDVAVDHAKLTRAACIHFHLGFGQIVGAECDAHPDEVTAYARAFAEWTAAEAAGGTLMEGTTLEAEIYAPVGALLEDYDALVCPTNATRGFVAGEDYVDGAPTIDGVAMRHYMDGVMTIPFNVMSRCPVLAVPSGLADNGVPTGVQIVGRTYDDPTVFALGAALEAARPFPSYPSAIAGVPA